jgi:hypothetical protein
VIFEAVKEVRLDYYLLCNLHILVLFFMPGNSSKGICTRHLGICHHFVHKFIESGVIKIEFIRSVEKVADIFTKCVSQELNVKHTKNLEDVGNIITV